MTVTTRNQLKTQINLQLMYLSSKYTLFNQKLNKLIVKIQNETKKENKLCYFLEIYQLINQDFVKRFQLEDISIWGRFICVTFDKIIELETFYRNGNYHKVNEEIINSFLNELKITKKFVVNIIKNYDGFEWPDVFSDAKIKIQQLESQRPIRNIKRINYKY